MSLVQHRADLIAVGLLVPNPEKPGAYKYATGYTAASAAAALRDAKGLAPKAPKGLKFVTTAEGASALVAKGTRRPNATIATNYADKFTGYCAKANEVQCQSRPGCTWMGGKINRCQRGTGKQKVQKAQRAEIGATKIQTAVRGFLTRRRLANLAM